MAIQTWLADNTVLLVPDTRKSRSLDIRIPVELNDIQGAWRRSWRETPTNHHESTRVMWMQSTELHVNIRLPAGVAEMQSAASLATLDTRQLRLLATAEGFAGRTSVSDSVCIRSRRINLQGPLKALDTGTLQKTSEGLLESGLHANYQQLWHSVDSEKPQQRMMTDTHGRTIIILWTQTRFALGRGWHGRTSHNRSLPEHVDFASGRQDQAALARAFDQEFCFGRIEDGQGIVEHSTQPMRRGTPAFDAAALLCNATAVEFQMVDFFGEPSRSEFRPSRNRMSMA